MPIITGKRALATVARIERIDPIPDADAIERAIVRDWGVVVRKGEFVAGDLVAYFEVDTALPLSDSRFAFLAPRGHKTVDGAEYHVLKTVRLRGVYSQGLVLPAGQFLDEITVMAGDLAEGTDLTGMIGLGKFEPPMPVGGGEQAGPFLTTYAAKTDSERAQNLGATWSDLSRFAWIASEKVDGTSMTIVVDSDGSIRVCGRNWEIREGDNVYWSAARRYRLAEHLSPGMAVQAEVAGPGIQGNPLRLSDVRVFVFAVTADRVPLPRDRWPAGLLPMAAPLIELPFPTSPSEAIAQVEGMRSAISPERQAEGVVWHTVDGRSPACLGRPTFKAINNAYLVNA